jgi:hypothetical protein
MILSQQDKMRGLLYASSSTDYFHNFVNSFGLVDLGFTRNPFTWSNHRSGHNLIRQRLDRSLASPPMDPHVFLLLHITSPSFGFGS